MELDKGSLVQGAAQRSAAVNLIGTGKQPCTDFQGKGYPLPPQPPGPVLLGRFCVFSNNYISNDNNIITSVCTA